MDARIPPSRDRFDETVGAACAAMNVWVMSVPRLVNLIGHDRSVIGAGVPLDPGRCRAEGRSASWSAARDGRSADARNPQPHPDLPVAFPGEGR